MPEGHRVFFSRFQNELKRVGEALVKKSWLIAQNYANDGVVSLASSLLAVQRFSQRLLMSIAATFPELRLLILYITQA